MAIQPDGDGTIVGDVYLHVGGELAGFDVQAGRPTFLDEVVQQGFGSFGWGRPS